MKQQHKNSIPQTAAATPDMIDKKAKSSALVRQSAARCCAFIFKVNKKISPITAHTQFKLPQKYAAQIQIPKKQGCICNSVRRGENYYVRSQFVKYLAILSFFFFSDGGTPLNR